MGLHVQRQCIFRLNIIHNNIYKHLCVLECSCQLILIKIKRMAIKKKKLIKQTQATLQMNIKFEVGTRNRNVIAAKLNGGSMHAHDK